MARNGFWPSVWSQMQFEDFAKQILHQFDATLDFGGTTSGGLATVAASYTVVSKPATSVAKRRRLFVYFARILHGFGVSLATAAEYEVASGPWGVLATCSEAPPGAKPSLPPALASYVPPTSPMNSDMVLRW